MNYFNKNSYNFITEDFDDIREFEILSGKDIIQRFIKSVNNVGNYINKKTKINQIRSSSFYVDRRHRTTFISSITDGSVYFENNNDLYKRISSTYKEEYKEISHFSTTLMPEHEFKNINTKYYYLFFHLPKDFVIDNMTRTLTDTGLKKFQEFANEFKLYKNNNLNHISKLIEKYDSKYTDLLTYQGNNTNKHPKMVKWRADFDIDFYMSLYHCGFFNPIVNDDDMRILWNGTHRAAYGASLGYDVPNFVYFTENEKKEEKFYRVSPPLFDDRCGIFEFDLNKKQISVKLVNKSELTEYITTIDDGCDIQGFSFKKNKTELKNLSKKIKTNFTLNINDKVENKFKLSNTRYIDDSIKTSLINFNFYNDVQILSILKNRNKNLKELKNVVSPWLFLPEYNTVNDEEKTSITYPKQTQKDFYTGDYLYLEIPHEVYKNFIHGWTDDVCMKYYFSENKNCNCYKCAPNSESHMTLQEVREYIRSGKKWKNKKNIMSSSYESYISLKYIGLQRPIMNFKTFLKRGVHRSLFLSETNSDVPNFFKVDSKSQNHVIVSERPYYKLKEYLLLDIDIKNKELKIYTSIDSKTKKKLLTKISYK